MSLGSGITPEWVLEKRALERRVQGLEEALRGLMTLVSLYSASFTKEQYQFVGEELTRARAALEAARGV
jgi:hypothetical protein